MDLHVNVLVNIPFQGQHSVELSCKVEKQYNDEARPGARNIYLFTSGIFLAAGAGLLYMFRNLVKAKINSDSGDSTGNQLRKAARACGLLSGTMIASLVGIPAAITAYFLHTDPSRMLDFVPVGFCDYPKKCLEALDRRIAELSTS